MIRLIPRLAWSGWHGCALGHEPHICTRSAEGRSLAIAWLGLHVELIFAVECGRCPLPPIGDQP